MAEKSVRFGVINNSGLRSATWKLWTLLGSGKKDVYVACRNIGGKIKLSLHETGQWHVAFDSRQFPSMFEEGNEPPSRFILQWNQPAQMVPGLTLACRVHIPWYAVSVPIATLERDVHWIEAPQSGQSIEVAVFLSEPGLTVTGWPGKRTMSTLLAGTLPLEGGGDVWVVYQTIPLVEPSLPPSSVPRYFRGASEQSLSEEGWRALVWGRSDDGSIVFYEAPVSVRKNDSRER